VSEDFTEAPESTRHARLYSVLAQIPAGCVISYGELAAQAELGRAARWVGRVLSQLPEGSALPWHRVLRADGTLAFAEGSASRQEQVQRLHAEGILLQNGRVNMRRYAFSAHLEQW